MRSLDKRRDDFFTPDVPPVDADDLPTWVFNQVTNLSKTINNVNHLHIAKISHFDEGYKPREGDIIWADEDLLEEPNNEEGIYVHMEGEWVQFSGGGSGVSGTPIGGIIMWSGGAVPEHWWLCDGSDAPSGMRTPNLINQFIKGSSVSSIGGTGGSSKTDGTAISTSQMPSHSHNITHTHNIGSHTHTQKGTFDTNERGDHSHGNSTGNAGAHDHGISTYLNNGGRHGAGGATNNRYYVPDPPWPTATAAPNHTHTISTDGDHKHAVTISGATAGSGTLSTGGSSNSSSGNSGSGNAHDHNFEPPYYELAYIMRWE